MNFLIRNIRGAFALCAGQGRYQNARSNLRLGLPEERTGIIVEPSRIWRLVQIEKLSTMNPVGQGIHSPSKVSRVMNKSARFATQWNSCSFRDGVSQLAMRTFSEDLEGRRLNRSSKKRVHCSTSKGGKVSRLSFLSKGALAGVLVLCSSAVSFASLAGIPEFRYVRRSLPPQRLKPFRLPEKSISATLKPSNKSTQSRAFQERSPLRPGLKKVLTSQKDSSCSPLTTLPIRRRLTLAKRLVRKRRRGSPMRKATSIV